MIASGRAHAGPLVAFAALLPFVVWALAAGRLLEAAAAPRDSALLVAQLDAAAATVGFVAVALCLLRWRLVGDAAALWLGMGALALGCSLLAAGATPPSGGAEPGLATALGWLPVSLRLAAVVVLVQAARTRQVDAGLRLSHAFATLAATVVAGVALFLLAPGLARVFANPGEALPMVDATASGAAVLAATWVGLALAHGLRGRRDRHWLHLWFGLALLSLGLAQTLWLLPTQGSYYWAAGPDVLGAYASLCMLAGATGEFVRAFSEQRGRLFETVTGELTAEARVRAEQLLAQERAHEARNALTAIEGASRTLEIYRDRLDPETQASLSRAISAEIARLQRLVSPEPDARSPEEFRVADTLTSVVVGARAGGMAIDMRIPTDLLARGRPGEVAEVVQNLVENARRYAPGSPVLVRAGVERDGVVVRVEDRGPGVAPYERRAVFDRGFRGLGAAQTDGSGLGLYICARLMREQDGELWVEDRPGGGASFALWLPAAGGAAAMPEEVAEAGHAWGAVGGAQTSPADNVYPLFGQGQPPRSRRGEQEPQIDDGLGGDAGL